MLRCDVPVTSGTRGRGHGRHERRTLQVTGAAAGLLFPRAAQAIQAVRRRRPLRSTKWPSETAYAITSLAAAQARPDQLAEALRGHRATEDRPHWVRDVTWGEDLSQVRTGSGPRVMAILRNFALAILRLAGATSTAAALRHNSRRPGRPGRPLQALISA